MLLTNNDTKWLAESYPPLEPSSDCRQVAGRVHFTAAYDKAEHKFTIIGSGDTKDVNGIILSCDYNITIRSSGNPERLPKLFVHDDGLSHEASRHFNPYDDGSACVCGVIEEAQFLQRGFDFQWYLERMVIPFLYGQKYYDKYESWPWRDYAHGTTGVLESYFLEGTEESIPVVLNRLRRILPEDYRHVKAILEHKNLPKGHMNCFCQRKDHIRRCHPEAWEGLKKLYSDVKLHGTKID